MGNYKQWINNKRTIALEWTAAEATGVTGQIFALDSDVVKTHKCVGDAEAF